MSGNKLIRWSGIMAVLGGACMAAYMLTHPWAQRTGQVATTSQWFLSHSLHLVGAILIVLGLFGLYLRQREETGKPGLLSFLLAYLGSALFVATGVTSTFLWPAVAFEAPPFVEDGGAMFSHPLALGPILAARVLMVLGYVWFGFVSFRAGVLPRGGSLLVMIGAVAMNLPTEPVGPVPWVVSVAGGVVLSLGFLSWGAALWFETPAAHDRPLEFLRTRKLVLGSGVAVILAGVIFSMNYASTVRQCLTLLEGGLLEVATDRSNRFLGKVGEAAAGCRGGERAEAGRDTPWVDWSNY